MSAKQEFTRNIVKIIVLCVILYGSLFYLAPFVAEIASKFTGGKTQVVVTAIVNSPTLSNLPQLVNKDTVTLEGISSANTQVELFLNESSYGKTSADNDGKFKFENVSIIKGVNKIQLQAKNSDGIESPKSKEYSLNFDDKKPEIKTINISNNQVITNLNKNVDIIGETSEPVDIEVNGKKVFKKEGTRFEYILGVNEGNVQVEVKLTDSAGNTNTYNYTITYKKG
jgi:hypothetical protein